MRILQISSAKTFGGGERHLIDLCRGLQARGHEIFIVVRPSCEWAEKFDFLPLENILHASIRNSFGIFSAKKIADFANKNKIEIIHAHVGRDYIPASISCRISKETKFVLTRHVLFPMKPFHKFALSNVEKAVAVSSAVGKNLENIFLKKKITTIPNGISITEESRQKAEKLREEFRSLHNIPFDAKLVGTMGELKELKGQRDFVLAANETAKQMPETRFVIVGKDHSMNHSFRRELKRLVKVFGLEESFLFLDWVDETTSFFAALDVYVSPSHSESFGLAILEAMTLGKPIVSTETDGAKELLQNNFSGRLVKIKEPFELSETICDLLKDEGLRENLGKNAQKTALEKFTLDKMIEQTEKVYEEVLQIGKKASA